MNKLVLAGALLGISMSLLAEDSKNLLTEDIKLLDKSTLEIISNFSGLGITVKQVADTPIPSLKQVVTDKGVLYTSSDGQFLIQGTIIDLVNRRNLTEDALNDVRKKGIERYADSMITFKAPNEKHSMTVFTDISCGYCRKLHRELDDYLAKGITVKYLAYPRGGLRGKGYEDLKSVWCAKDPAEALTAAKEGQDVDGVPGCNAPVAEHYQLGQSFGISGTPAIILEDGSIIPGYQPADVISQMLDTAAKTDY